MLELGWSSHKATDKHSLRSYLIAFWAATYALLFMAAGVLSNNAISAASERGISPVLLRSKSCGTWNETYHDIMSATATVAHFDISVDHTSKTAQDAQLSMEYAQECYLSPSTITDTFSTCRTLKSRAIGWNTSTTNACPFDRDLCNVDAGVVRLDTGKIDSHTHLGINAKQGDRLSYQRVTTCAILNDTAHVTGWNGTMRTSANAEPSPSVAYAFYGPNNKRGTVHTYSYSNFADFYTNYTAAVTQPYQLHIDKAFAKSDPVYSTSEFDPDTRLVQVDADQYVIFLSYTGYYLEPVDDPWFSAHQAHENAITHRDFFGRDRAISTMGCTDQHEFCTPDNICTGLLGFDQIQNVASFTNILTAHQNVTFDRLLRAVSTSTLSVISWLSQTTAPLKAGIGIGSGKSGTSLSPGLPNDQWKKEIDFWQSIAMAHLQREVVQWASGQIAPTTPPQLSIIPAVEPQDVWFCDNFMIMSGFYQSFNVLAIILITVFGLLVILGSLFIEELASLFRRCLKRTDKRKHWELDDMLKLRGSTIRARSMRISAANKLESSNFWQGDVSTYRPKDLSHPLPSHNVSITDKVTYPWAHQHPHVMLTTSSHQTRLEPQKGLAKDSWTIVSLDSLDSGSSKTPVHTIVQNRPNLVCGPCSNVSTPKLNKRAECSPATAQAMRWI